MTGVGLGWLQGTIKSVEPQQVLALLSHVIGSEAEDRPGGTRWYSESATIGLHALAAWASRNRPDAVETYWRLRDAERAIALVSAIVLAVSVGISRIYLGVHWLSDVIGGYLAGALWLLLLVAAWAVLSRLRRGRRRDAAPGHGEVRPVPSRPVR